MASNIRYDSKTWLSRPTMGTWKVLKPYIGYPPGTIDMSLPPKFGHCIDTLREKYGIYISVTPHYQTLETEDEQRKLAFHFYGVCTIMPDPGVVADEFSYTGQEYNTVMNSALEKAINYLKSRAS